MPHCIESGTSFDFLQWMTWLQRCTLSECNQIFLLFFTMDTRPRILRLLLKTHLFGDYQLINNSPVQFTCTTLASHITVMTNFSQRLSALESALPGTNTLKTGVIPGFMNKLIIGHTPLSAIIRGISLESRFWWRTLIQALSRVLWKVWHSSPFQVAIVNRSCRELC